MPLEYLEIAGFKFQKENFGKPTDAQIEINPEIAAFDRPQAWSLETEGQTHWLYNLPGAQKESESLGVQIPTLEELMKIFSAIPGNALEKAKFLNIALAGYRNMNNGEFVSGWKRATLWSSSQDGPMMADSICLQMSCDHAHANLYGLALGLSVRGILK